jgi:hypothetical protein
VVSATSNPSVATVSGNVVTLVATGTTTITATQAGSADFEAAAPVGRTLTVNPTGPSVPAVPPVALLLLAAVLIAVGRARVSRSR